MHVESITIAVEPEKKNLSKIDVNPISQCESTLKQIHGDIWFSSLKPDQKIILYYKTHPVFEGFVSAYREHRPITISPDIIWLLIAQAFSNHVSLNSEDLRSMFFNFSGKKDLIVEENVNILTITPKDWEQLFFPKFVSQISDYTGKDLIETLTPNFTTTTPVSLAVGQLTIMSTMKNYFNYICDMYGCGFPYITIEGTVEDWKKVSAKLANLSKYKFEWFTKTTIPIIKSLKRRTEILIMIFGRE